MGPPTAWLFVSPLESSESFEINLTIVPEPDLSMQMPQGWGEEGKGEEREFR